MKYFINTYGCQMNIHESEKLAGSLIDLGYENCEKQDDADIIVFNTCCIRENAENHVYGNIGALKKLKKEKKNLIIAVGGCMTQQDGLAEKLKNKFPYVDIIFGTHNLNQFKDMVLRKLNSKKRIIEILDKEGKILEEEKSFRTSFPNAWVNIMYGCNNFCTYCIVPYVRGRERSRNLNSIITEVKELVAQGYKEITLLGQNVNSYGNDLNENSTFTKLLAEICKIPDKFRLRFMTNHPKDFKEDLVKVMLENEKICKCIHLPVQAGSNNILKLMNRKYTKEDYLNKLKLIRSYMPNCQITTDIMVGFPQETENDFLETLDLVKQADFAGAFTFVYSLRSGTKAAEMTGHIDDETKKDRIVRLIELVNKQNRTKANEYINKNIEILCEDYDDKKKMYLGRDEYNRMVYFKSDIDLIGKFIEVNITEANGISLLGKKI